MSTNNEITILEKIRYRMNHDLSKNYTKLKPYLEDKLVWKEFIYTRGEIMDCLLIEANQASVTLTNSFLEKIMKQALMYYYSGGEFFGKPPSYYRDATAKYDNMSLNSSIEECFLAGLIDKDQKEKLHYYRSKIRNPYSHAESKKLFKDLNFTSTENGVKSVHNLGELPRVQGMTLHFISDLYAFPYFAYVHDILKLLEKKIAKQL